jgi:hypothetical protein
MRLAQSVVLPLEEAVEKALATLAEVPKEVSIIVSWVHYINTDDL